MEEVVDGTGCLLVAIGSLVGVVSSATDGLLDVASDVLAIVCLLVGMVRSYPEGVEDDIPKGA